MMYFHKEEMASKENSRKLMFNWKENDVDPEFKMYKNKTKPIEYKYN